MVESKILIIARGREGRRVEGEKSASLRDSKAESGTKRRSGWLRASEKRWRRPKDAGLTVTELKLHYIVFRDRGSTLTTAQSKRYEK